MHLLEVCVTSNPDLPSHLPTCSPLSVSSDIALQSRLSHHSKDEAGTKETSILTLVYLLFVQSHVLEVQHPHSQHPTLLAIRLSHH